MDLGSYKNRHVHGPRCHGFYDTQSKGKKLNIQKMISKTAGGLLCGVEKMDKQQGVGLDFQ